jgi:diguanylate cyclase (GGDEF)-like protein
VASAGLLVALLLFTLVQVLSRGRARALRMVAEKTDQLRHQALHDTLTDLPNRALIVDRAQQALVRGRREHCAPAAMFIDLDNFKGVNDMFGHAVGDALLRAVAARVSAVLREGDTVGRIGGDEFVVLVEGGPAKADPELVAERLLQVLREPYELPGTDGPIVATASIGLAIGDRVSADALLRDADIALYEAKAAGRNTAVVFRQEMQAAVHDRLALETDLRHAVENDELRLDYQPVFDLEQNRITGVEALLRWDHPARGAVMPCEFIPLAEETGLILELGAWALETACRQGAAWHASGYRVRMAVNVSARQLAEPGFPAAVQAALEATGFDPHWLVLEVTETMLMQNTERTAARLAALTAVGVRIAIDDFGTGYSSLAYLQQFPVDALKIDRAFIAGIARSPESKALIHTLVELGKSLGLETVAEGIEQTVQLSHLRREECASGQGFLLARPLAPGQVERLLEREAA